MGIREKDKIELFILIIIILLGLFFRTYNLNKQPLGYFWDEGYYAQVIKNMHNEPHNFLYPTYIDGPDLHYYDKRFPVGRILMNRPPAFFWFGALFVKLFGMNEIVLKLPSVIFGTLSILLLYYLTMILYDKRTALLASFLFATYPMHIILSRTVMLEATVNFFVILLAYLLIKGVTREKKVLLIGSSFTIALLMLTRGIEILLIAGIYAALCITQWAERRKHLYFAFFMLIIGVGIYLIWPIILWLTPHRYDGFLWCLRKNIWYMLTNFNLGDKFNFSIKLWEKAHIFLENRLDILIPSVFVFIMLMRRRNADIILSLSFLFYFVPISLFSYASWRYLAPIYPVYAAISATVFIDAYKKITIKALRIPVSIFMIIFFVTRAAAYPAPSQYKDYKRIGDYIKTRIKDYKFSAIVVNSPLMTYYTDKFAVSINFLHKSIEEYVLNKEVRFVEVTDRLEKSTAEWVKRHGKLINGDIGTLEDKDHHFYDCSPEYSSVL